MNSWLLTIQRNLKKQNIAGRYNLVNFLFVTQLQSFLLKIGSAECKVVLENLKLCAFNFMTNTFFSLFSDVFIITLAFLSQIFHFGCHIHHVRMALIVIYSIFYNWSRVLSIPEGTPQAIH